MTIIDIGASTRDLRVQRGDWRGKDYVDIRQFVVVDASGDRVPTKKGVHIPLDKVDEVCKAIKDAAKKK